MTNCSTVTISGTAADAGGGVVAGIEVSIDGGATWHPAIGGASWVYNWTPKASGMVTIKSRAVDDNGNLEAPLAGVNVTGVNAPTLPCPSVGSSQDTGDSNYMTGSQVTVGAQPVTVTALSAYVGAVDPTAANRRYSVAIYSDSNGAPGSLVATSAAGTLTANAWNTLAVNATLAANTSYWLMYNANGSSANYDNLAYDTAATNVGAWAPQSFGAWPASFNGATVTNQRYSLYATVS